MLVRVGRVAEALWQLEEALAVSRDLAAQDAREEAQLPLTYAHVYEEAQVPLPSYPFLSAPILT
jgi:P2-related tail formation protein